MAAFFYIHAGANTNFGTVDNWSATSGGGTNSATPSVTSDVTFDGAGANGNDACVVAASVSCLSLTFTAGYTNTVTINTTRILTIAGNFTDNTAHSWTVSGTGSLTISAASTITSGGKTFPGPVALTNANTKTLVGDWTITGTLTFSGATVLNWTTNETLSCAGLAGASGCSGTALITLTGGTWNTTTNPILNNLTFAGNITVSGSPLYNTGTITYSSGTITTTSSTLTFNGSATLNTNGITWNNIATQQTATITINSLLSVSGTFTIAANNIITFAGTSGFTAATFTCSHTQAITITLVNNVTYTITTAFNAFNSRTGSILLFTSDHASNKAILTLNNGATCNVLASFTRIDASGGREIDTFNGTLTTCTNIRAITDLTFRSGRVNLVKASSNY